MNEPTIEKISAELSDRLMGEKFGKIFILSRYRLAIDFRLADGTYLFIGVDPNAPRIYLIKRPLKALEKKSGTGFPFFSKLRKHLVHLVVRSIEKAPDERVIKLKLSGKNDLGETRQHFLIIQLTGRSSNLFLLDQNGKIMESLRNTEGEGQIPGSFYSPPDRITLNAKPRRIFPQASFASLSEALDAYYIQKEIDDRFRSLANSVLGGVSNEIKKKTRLRKRLHKDIENHGEPEKWKHLGEVLLANVANAKRIDNKLIAVDYFAPESPLIEIESDEKMSVTEAAEYYFRLYSKARNARTELSIRLETLENEIETLESRRTKLHKAIAEKDEEAIESFLRVDKKQAGKTDKGKNKDPFPGTKIYSSSDGFEILVGKRSKDNDYLTFRIAKSLDIWLHAADYPGSHVVIRNPNRKEIPQTTLVEAAGLAAFFSKAKTEAKAAVHYTQKKFVNKPKGGAPGLVSLASFKTILVKPKIPGN